MNRQNKTKRQSVLHCFLPDKAMVFSPKERKAGWAWGQPAHEVSRRDTGREWSTERLLEKWIHHRNRLTNPSRWHKHFLYISSLEPCSHPMLEIQWLIWPLKWWTCQAWRHKPVIPASGRQRQKKDREFQASLNCIARPVSNNPLPKLNIKTARNLALKRLNSLQQKQSLS